MSEITEHIFVEESGEEQFYLASGPTDGPLIILCHGWPAIARTWEAQINAFAAVGYRIIAPDMPG